MSGGTQWSPRNLSPKTYEFPRIVTFSIAAGNAVLYQLDTTAAEKVIVQVMSDESGTPRIGLQYNKNGDTFWINADVVLTFDGPRHPFWRPFYLRGEGADDLEITFWMSGTQDGPIT